MTATMTNTTVRMWAQIQDGHILSVYPTRTAARASRDFNFTGVIKPVLVSLA